MSRPVPARAAACAARQMVIFPTAKKAARPMSCRFFMRSYVRYEEPDRIGLVPLRKLRVRNYLSASTRRPSAVAVTMQLEYPSRFSRNRTKGAAGARQPDKSRPSLPFLLRDRLRSARHRDISPAGTGRHPCSEGRATEISLETFSCRSGTSERNMTCAVIHNLLSMDNMQHLGT
jgi:hypothetical protein